MRAFGGLRQRIGVLLEHMPHVARLIGGAVGGAGQIGRLQAQSGADMVGVFERPDHGLLEVVGLLRDALRDRQSLFVEPVPERAQGVELLAERSLNVHQVGRHLAGRAAEGVGLLLQRIRDLLKLCGGAVTGAVQLVGLPPERVRDARDPRLGVVAGIAQELELALQHLGIVLNLHAAAEIGDDNPQDGERHGGARNERPDFMRQQPRCEIPAQRGFDVNRAEDDPKNRNGDRDAEQDACEQTRTAKTAPRFRLALRGGMPARTRQMGDLRDHMPSVRQQVGLCIPFLSYFSPS